MTILEVLGQSIIYGVLQGALYGLVAVGMSLILGVMGILFVAHGSMLMLGAYLAYFLFATFGIDPFLSLPVGAIALFLLGLGIYRVFYSRVLRFAFRLKLDTSLLISFGLLLTINAVATLIFTPDERGINPAYAGASLALLTMRVPYIPLGAMCVAVVSVIALLAVLHKTYFGKSIRATAQDWQAATLMGINIDRTYLLSFALGTGLAALGGSMIATLQSFSPEMGFTWLIRGIVVMILAGMGSVGGVFTAGLLLGVVESISAIWVSSYTQVVSLVVFLLVVMFKPRGLFGRKE